MREFLDGGKDGVSPNAFRDRRTEGCRCKNREIPDPSPSRQSNCLKITIIALFEPSENPDEGTEPDKKRRKMRHKMRKEVGLFVPES